MKLPIIVVAALVLLVSIAAWFGVTRSSRSNDESGTGTTIQGIDSTKYPLDKADSIWVIVNKHRQLNPSTFIPTDLTMPQVKVRSNITRDELQLRAEAAAALEGLFAAAANDKIVLNVQSGFRSHELQDKLYSSYVKQQGQSVADTQSARPGYSEHQTGLAVDVGGESKPDCNVQSCFADTPEGKWVAEHAHEYGFIVRYPPDKIVVTGYLYEPWHLRYVGTELSAKFGPTSKQTLEEFFKLENASDYR